MFRSLILVRAPLTPFRPPVNANTTSIRHKSAGKGFRFAPPPSKPQQSVRLTAQVGQEGADIGLLVDTFIMPTGKNLPSLFTSPKERFVLERRRIKQKLIDLRDMLVFRYTTGHPLHPFQARKFSETLHQAMYTAFSLGDIDTLRTTCGEGLLSSFRKRLSVRPSNVRMEWRLHRMLSRPRVVSSKAHHYAGIGLSRRQVVVRLHSVQSLAKVTLGKQVGRGQVEVLAREGGEEKEVVEYLVIEKKYDVNNKGGEGVWCVWGTTEETTVDRLKQMDEQKRLLGLV